MSESKAFLEKVYSYFRQPDALVNFTEGLRVKKGPNDSEFDDGKNYTKEGFSNLTCFKGDDGNEFKTFVTDIAATIRDTIKIKMQKVNAEFGSAEWKLEMKKQVEKNRTWIKLIFDVPISQILKVRDLKISLSQIIEEA